MSGHTLLTPIGEPVFLADTIWGLTESAGIARNFLALLGSSRASVTSRRLYKDCVAGRIPAETGHGLQS